MNNQQGFDGPSATSMTRSLEVKALDNCSASSAQSVTCDVTTSADVKGNRREAPTATSSTSREAAGRPGSRPRDGAGRIAVRNGRHALRAPAVFAFSACGSPPAGR